MLLVEKGTFVLSTSTGDQDITLNNSSLTPKAVILWSAGLASDGPVDGDGIFSWGVGTRDGGATQQHYICYFADDGVANSDCLRDFNSDAVLKGLSTYSATDSVATDYECTLVSFGAGTFRINKSNAPASAIDVHYMVFGGDDITAARAGNFVAGTAVATQDVTINTGWGQPDFVMFDSHISPNNYSANDARMMLGFDIPDGGKFAYAFTNEDANNTMVLGAWYSNNRSINCFGAATGVDAEAALDAKSSFPTDGFRLAWSNQASIAVHIGYLAFKGDFVVAVGEGAMLTGASQQLHELGSGNFLKGALAIGGLSALTSGTPDTTSTELGGVWVGGASYDGSNTFQGVAGAKEDDAAADALCGRWQYANRMITHHDAAAAAATLTGEGIATISNDDLSIDWSGNPSAIAADYVYALFGTTDSGGPAAPTILPQMPQVHKSMHRLRR